MSFYSFSKFKILASLLIVLIIWQVIRLIPDKALVSTLPEPVSIREVADDNNNQKPLDSIIELEDDKYNKHKVDKIKVRVYYEALCPDSKYFFTKHLNPVTEKLQDYLDVSLVPYGKATTREDNGQYSFTCQHGEEECYANKVHACSIDHLANMSMSVKFTSCMIQDNFDADAALQRCAKLMEVKTEDISKCASSVKGSALLKKYGDDTHRLAPSFIPTILLNGSRDHQPLILKNFLLEICKLIDMPLPPPCL